MNMQISKYRIWLALACFLIGIDIILRISIPELGADLFQNKPAGQDSLLAYSSTIGYEPKPFAAFRPDGIAGMPTEQLNSEGFRGPDYIIPKPYNTYRILVVGDSVAQGFSVLCGQTWVSVLGDALNSYAAASKDNIDYEVINAGVGGYVSWQVFLRLRERGFKYEPDLILVFAGWNDMLFSSLPFWTPEIELSKIERVLNKQGAANDDIKRGLLKRIRRQLYRISYTARLIRRVRNKLRREHNIQSLIKQRRTDSNREFNEEALGLYTDNLERIYNTVKAHGAVMGLITWPAIINQELSDDKEINRRLLLVYSNFTLSTGELLSWYERYIDAQRRFAAEHPDVVLFDAAKAFAKKDKRGRINSFVDLCHLTAAGNREFADVILRELQENGII